MLLLAVFTVLCSLCCSLLPMLALPTAWASASDTARLWVRLGLIFLALDCN